MKAFLLLAFITLFSFFDASAATETDFHIYWHAAYDPHLLKANCKTTKTPGVGELMRYFQDMNLHDPIAQQTVGNLDLHYQSRWVTKLFKSLFTSANTDLFVQRFDIPFNCHNVICAVRSIWGEELGLKILYMRVRFGLNASEYAFKNADRFKINEINDAIMAILDLPSPYIRFMNNQQFSRYERGRGSDDPDTLADSQMFFYDLWEKETTLFRQKTVFHEIAHHIGDLHDIHHSAAWKNASGWENGADGICRVSNYGATGIKEDFAETVVMYRYRPHLLQKICKKKYDFMKYKVFKGIEFDSNEHCSKTSRAL